MEEAEAEAEAGAGAMGAEGAKTSGKKVMSMEQLVAAALMKMTMTVTTMVISQMQTLVSV